MVTHYNRISGQSIERLAALSESDRRALERAVAVLESLAAERPGPAPVAVADPGRTKELEA